MTSVTNQTSSMIEETNSLIRSAHQTQKKGSARIAEDNSSIQGLGELQKVEKEVIVKDGVSISDHEQSAMATKLQTVSQESGKPQLPYPQKAWNALMNLGDDGHQPGLISIIGTVLALQAKMNSSFYSTVFKQATASMMAQVAFAPVIGTAIKQSYDAESDATKSQASEALTEGLVGAGMFIGGLIGAGLAIPGDPDSPFAPKDDDIGLKDETNQNGGNTLTDNELEDANNPKTFLGKAVRFGKKVWSGMGTARKTINYIFDKGYQRVMMMQMASDASTKVFVTAKYKAQQAVFQALQGTTQAVSKEAEQYSQFYGQDYSRQQELASGSSSMIEYAMQVMKSAADTITQTVTSMFRG